MKRNDAEQIGKLIQQFLRQESLESPLNEQRLLDAWPQVLGPAAAYTSNLYIRNQTLYVHLTSAVFRYSPQSGSALENLVYNELRNKGYMNISFDNSKTECDFLAYKNGKAYGFQVCYELNDMNLKRELYGFELENVMLEKKTLLTYNQKETYGDIEVVPFWEWVMSPPFT